MSQANFKPNKSASELKLLIQPGDLTSKTEVSLHERIEPNSPLFFMLEDDIYDKIEAFSRTITPMILNKIPGHINKTYDDISMLYTIMTTKAFSIVDSRSYFAKSIKNDPDIIMFNAVCKKAGIPTGIKTEEGLVSHDIRRTASTRIIESGLDVYHVKELLGHSDVRVTERYLHTTKLSKQATDVLEKYHKTGQNHILTGTRH